MPQIGTMGRCEDLVGQSAHVRATARPWLLAAVLALGLVASPVTAHKLKVFARVEAGEIVGSAYFVGGARAAGALIRILDPGGTELARLTPDEQGRFRYRPTHPGDYRVEADSGDGHVARWTLTAGEFGSGLTPPAAAAATPKSTSRPAASGDPALAVLVEEAVARQIAPLREQLLAYEDKVRLHDVLGGLGYILGLAGMALWWRSRTRGGR
jgi:nickel transport protein